MARQTGGFIARQADIVREYAHPGQFVTTCLHYGHPALEDEELTDPLDVTAGNPYYDVQDARALPDPAPDDHAQGWKTAGALALHQSADRVSRPRTGYADHEARARREPGPARLVAAGVA